MMSGLDQLIALGRQRKVHAHEHGGLTLHFRGLNKAEINEYRDAIITEKYASTSDELFVAMCLCNEAGAPEFVDAATRDSAIEAITQWDRVELLEPIIHKMNAASGIGKPAQDAIEKK